MKYIKLTDRKFYALLFIIVLAAIIFIYNVYPSFRSPIEASGDTDYPVLLSAIFALIMSALTLLVSWFIKTEAEGIGDSIISNTVIHRHLDRMLHEYTLIVLKEADDAQANSGGLDNRIFAINVSCDSSKWFFGAYNSEYSGDFFKNLMPGKSGDAFSKIINFENLSAHLKGNLLGKDGIQGIPHKVQKIKAAYVCEKEERRLLEVYYSDPGLEGSLYNLLTDDYDNYDNYIYEYRESPQEPKDFDPYESARVKQQKIAELAQQNYLNLSSNSASQPEESDRASANRENLFKIDKFVDNKSAIEEMILGKKEAIKELREGDSNSENIERFTKAIDRLEEEVRTLEFHLRLINGYLEAKETASKEDSQINSSGAAIYAMMKALGWKLPLEFRGLEKELEDSYQRFLGRIPKAAY